MKKAITLSIFILVLAGGAFALNPPPFTFSIGGGIFYAGDYKEAEASRQTTLSSVPIEYSPYGKTDLSSFGFFGFFDATYFEVNLGYFAGQRKTNIVVPTEDSLFTGLIIGVFGKYPFVFGKISVFPLLGVEYQLFLSGRVSGLGPIPISTDTEDFNAFWYKFGFGADFALTETLFLRGEFLYGFRQNTNAEDELERICIAMYPSSPVSVDQGVGHGPSLKFAVGYKF
ncbi:MAG: hypothetical protein LBQ14_10725 [Treponema sp.]|jgi:hypothetical protein|nr:hypothetical protein [Treponema sp.]